MTERESDHFDLDDDFVAESEEDQDYDRFIDRGEKRVRAPAAPIKKGKAAWSKLEDVLAERRLQRELKEFDDEL